MPQVTAVVTDDERRDQCFAAWKNDIPTNILARVLRYLVDQGADKCAIALVGDREHVRLREVIDELKASGWTPPAYWPPRLSCHDAGSCTICQRVKLEEMPCPAK